VTAATLLALGAAFLHAAALREFSVVLGALAGWLLLRERLGRPRVFASAVVAAGLALLVVLR